MYPSESSERKPVTSRTLFFFRVIFEPILLNPASQAVSLEPGRLKNNEVALTSLALNSLNPQNCQPGTLYLAATSKNTTDAKALATSQHAQPSS